MANMRPRSLPDISGFQPLDQHAEDPDLWGHFVIERHDRQGSEINVDASIGWQRPTGPKRVKREPDVLHIEHVDVTEGQHLGAAALYLAIQHARHVAAEQGIQLHEGRMQIINPRAVWMVEKLREMGLIQGAFYLINGQSEPHRLPPTDGFEQLPELVPAAEAAQYMDAQDAKQAAGAMPEELGVICCKFTF